MKKIGKGTIITSVIILTVAVTMGATVFATENSGGGLKNAVSPSNTQSQTAASQDTSKNGASNANVKEFTTEELAKYNGKNGQAAYIAVDGVVYDASMFFTNGSHHGATAGSDVTTSFYDETPVVEVFFW